MTPIKVSLEVGKVNVVPSVPLKVIELPKDIVLPSVPENVSELVAANVFPADNVSVPVPAVMVLPLRVVAVAAPMFGVVKTGLTVKATVVPDPLVVISPSNVPL